MTIALPKGDFLVTAGFAAIAGAGVASIFTVFDNASTWYLVLVAVVTLGAYPLLAGWLSPRLMYVAFFPISVLVSLSIASRQPLHGGLSFKEVLRWKKSRFGQLKTHLKLCL